MAGNGSLSLSFITGTSGNFFPEVPVSLLIRSGEV